MFSQEFKQFIRSSLIAIAGFMSGASIALILMEYPGSFEFRVTGEEGHLKMDGRPRCEFVSHVQKP